MENIKDIVTRFSGSLTDDQKDELYNLLKNTKPADIKTLEEHKLYLDALAKLRSSIIRGMRLAGENFLKTLESLLSVGEDGVYSNRFRFVYELIQNVDDCEYENAADCHLDIQFIYDQEPGQIILTYNEKGFKPGNVFAITGIAESSKNISADKVEIGEKGIGFKSVFGIADKVLIQSGMFSFELSKNNFTVPVPQYDGFSPIKGTRLVLQMPAESCEEIFDALSEEYSDKNSLLTQNPILFLYKLTHLKMYLDDCRYIEFDVQRTTPEKRGNLLFESNVAISLNMQIDNDSDSSPINKEICCYRYTMPLEYGKEECQSRYGEDTAFSKRIHNIIGIFPVIKNDPPFTEGLLYSFLPTAIDINAPLILHAPFKLDGSREFVDPQKINRKISAWFMHTLINLIDFIKSVYLDIAKIEKKNIIHYLPKYKDYIFKQDNAKVKCLAVEGLKGNNICDEKIFFTESNRFESSANIISFGKDVKLKNPNEAYQLLNEAKDLFIPPYEVNMNLYGGEIIKDVASKLFSYAIQHDEALEEILTWLEKSDLEFNYEDLLRENKPVTFSVDALTTIGKHPRLIKAIHQISEDSINAQGKPLLYIEEDAPKTDPAKRKEIIDLIHESDLDEKFITYLNKVHHNFFVFPCKTTYAVLAYNGVALSKDTEVGAFGKASEQYDRAKTFTASLQIRQVSEQLNHADDSMNNAEYLIFLRGLRSSLKRAFGDRMYKSYIKLIADAGTDKNRFLSELLQNADDCQYIDGIDPEFILEKTEDGLKVFYNETGFTKANVRALTAIGESTKKQLLNGNDRVTGEKGVGFKSVFGVAEQVEIHSNGFHFRLTDKKPTIPDTCNFKKETSGTTMFFKMKENIEDSFNQDRILKLCICLHHLKHISIARSDVTITDNDEKRIITINKIHKYEFKKFIHYFTVTDQEAIDERNANMRAINPEQEIILYIPIKSKEHGYFVYSGLPVEIKCNIPLIVDAPFELTTSRENIQKNKWNDIIRDEMYNAIISFMKSIASSDGFDILKYVGFHSKDENPSWRCFENNYLNKFDWKEDLQHIPFIPVTGSDSLMRFTEISSHDLFPEFICRTGALPGIVNITGKTKYAPILEAIGLKKADKDRIRLFLQRHVQEYINDVDFREGLYSYLSNKFKPLNIAYIKDLPIFPVKTSDGTKYISFPGEIYIHDSMVSNDEYYILDTEIMPIELSDKLLDNKDRITPLTQEVFDYKYQENIKKIIKSNHQDPETVATYLLNEFNTNRASLLKCLDSLRGLIDKIPMLMEDGQFKKGKKYLNYKMIPFDGMLLSHLLVHQSYSAFAQILGLEDFTKINWDSFDFDIYEVTDDDISDIAHYLKNNYTNIIKYFIEQNLLSEEQIRKYNLEWAIETEDPDDDDDYEEFPERPVTNPGRLKSHVLEQCSNPNPYIDIVREVTDHKPQRTFDPAPYTSSMYRSAYSEDKHFCQMCQKKTSSRYIERNNIEKKPKYAWEQLYLCLCLKCSKDYVYLRNNDTIWKEFIRQIRYADVMESGVIEIPIGDRTITFTATHLAEIQEILKEQEKME